MAEYQEIPKDLYEAETLVGGLSIDDLRVFCSTFGLDDIGTKVELKERLLQYYRSKIEAKLEIELDERNTLPPSHRETLIEQRLESSEERIIRVEHSIHEMQSSMQNEFSVFRKTMETMMGKLQQPRFSTPQPPKSAVSERVSNYGQCVWLCPRGSSNRGYRGIRSD